MFLLIFSEQTPPKKKPAGRPACRIAALSRGANLQGAPRSGRPGLSEGCSAVRAFINAENFVGVQSCPNFRIFICLGCILTRFDLVSRCRCSTNQLLVLGHVSFTQPKKDPASKI